MHRSRRIVLALSSVAVLALSACGSDDPTTAAGDADAPAAAADAFPITIEHAFGESVIEAAPERIAAIGWSNGEVPLALGIVPVGMGKATWGDDDGDGVLPWVEEKLEELDAETPVLYDETEGIDFEAVADSSPDVILAVYSGLTQEDYDTLSQIAPVVAYPEVPWGATLEQIITLNSEALGLAAEGEQLVSDTQQTVAEAAAERPELAGKSIMFATIDPTDMSQVGYYTTHDPRASFLEEAGLTTPALVTETTASSDEFYLTISAEEGDRLADVDVFVTYGDDAMLAQAQADPLLKQIPAVARGSVALLPNSTPLAASANPTPLSVGWNIGEYLDLLQAAAVKAG